MLIIALISAYLVVAGYVTKEYCKYTVAPFPEKEGKALLLFLFWPFILVWEAINS